MLTQRQRDWIIKDFKHNRMDAHAHLFKHRHKDETPEFHREILNLLYSENPLVALMAFRGAAKSTYLEEYVLLTALFRESAFELIVGPKWESACERLAPIRHELETNDAIIELFGDQKAAPWSMDELVLANGVKIQAIGASQSMRGKKHNDERPDLAVIDDLEDEENIRTEESRSRTERWLTGTLLPALHPTKGRVRFAGTAIHPKSLILKKCNDPEWTSKIFPILYFDLQTGAETSAWPSRFPLSWIKKKKQEYLSGGNYVEFEQEYMCRAEDQAGKPFQASMLKVGSPPAADLPVYIFVDPARTVKEKSARTGYAAWSWFGNKLIVYKAEGHFDKPDQIIARILEWDKLFSPVHVGVEAVGLEEFLMQPLRAACIVAGKSIPFTDIRAPKDKISFIKSLQPFYIAGDVTHVGHLPDLESELLQFPTGRMDVPNALAYALRMRAGRAVYDDFAPRHLAVALDPRRGVPLYLCVSSRQTMTAGVLVQYDDGVIRVLADFLYNEPPMECMERMIRSATLVGGQVKVAAPQEQFEQFNNTGLIGSIRLERIQPIRAGSAKKCEGQLRPFLQKDIRGVPAFIVSDNARWVKNGLAGGYCRKLDKHGGLSTEPTDNGYRLVLEALECWVAYLCKSANVEDDTLSYAYKDGKRYISLRPQP